MSIFTNTDPGTKVYRSRFNLSYRKLFDADYGKGYPVLAQFCLPGDIWHIGGNVLIRYQPMLSPSLTKATARVRYFFVPLRLVEANTEKIITGSNNGKLIETELPTFSKMFDYVGTSSDYKKVSKGTFWDIMGIPCLDYSNITQDKSIPCAYWNKGYNRIFWDFYRDENLDSQSSNGDFDSYNNYLLQFGGQAPLFSVRLRKDYFTSCLPWQLKGVAPTIALSGGHVTFSGNISYGISGATGNQLPVYTTTPGAMAGVPFNIPNDSDQAHADTLNARFRDTFNGNNTIDTYGTLNADQFRDMMAQTRIFERLARCGSRYTEYLHSNFQIAPADGTLQRPLYLGGWSVPIVQTEVVQTAADGNNAVGTLRGHGITNGGNRISNFVCREFGMLFGIMDVLPKTQYTQGIPRQFTYASRFDFFNPSFQHLSEQEVRNGELFISNTDGLNDETFGFQAYANELRSNNDIICGELRDTMKYWTQGISFSSRPNLNSSFLSSGSYTNNYHQNFAVTNTNPMIVDFQNDLDVYRPMVRYATPGLIDHL